MAAATYTPEEDIAGIVDSVRKAYVNGVTRYLTYLPFLSCTIEDDAIVRCWLMIEVTLVTEGRGGVQ